jgi:hypothetical protein
MRKDIEIIHPGSCLNKASTKEPIFVLRARDPAAPGAIRAWATMRVILGINKSNDEKIVEAYELAKLMEDERHLYAKNKETK